MAKAGTREKYECEPITDDFDKLSTFGASIGVELMYMSRTEAVEPIPPQEEGEEEPGSEGPIEQNNEGIDKNNTPEGNGAGFNMVENGSPRKKNDTENVVTEGVSNLMRCDEGLKMVEKMNNE